MRLALTHPWCWPAVQRGGERLFADLTCYLASAGHEVLAVSASPGPPSRRDDGHLHSVTHRSFGRHLPPRLDLDQAVTYLPGAAWTVRRWQPDLLHGLYHLDGLVGRLAGGRPCVVQLQGIPRRAALVGRPMHRRLLGPSLRGADAVVAVSQAAADAFEAEFGGTARVLHNGVYTHRFVRARASTPRTSHPSILFPSATDDPRKRLDVLLGAVRQLAAAWPDLTVSIAATTPAATRAQVQSRASVPIEWLSVPSPDDMAAVYARAWVTCAPAVREAFGLVFIESMAAGTPAVGVRDGGVAEVVREARWLAAPDDQDSLAEALDRALTDAQDATIVARCQDMASAFDWSERGPAFEALYRDLVSEQARP